MDDNDGVPLTEWLAQMARAHRILLGSIAAHVVLWIAAPRLWALVIATHSRSGRTGWSSVGERDLILVGLAVVVYVLAAWIGPRGRWGMRPASSAEVVVARALVRIVSIVGMWVAFVIAARAL